MRRLHAFTLFCVALAFLGACYAHGSIALGDFLVGIPALGLLRVLERPEVAPRWTANNARFISRVPVEPGLIRGIAFEITGTTVTDSALNDDAPWTLIANLEVTLPLKKGNVVIPTTGRDLFLASRYLTGKVRQNQTAATAGVTFSSFLLPFGPEGWGIHSSAFRPGAEIMVTGTWAAASEYGASTTSITAGILRPYLYVDSSFGADPNRRCLIPVTTPIAVESEARVPGIRLNKPEMAQELFAILYRQEDSSAAADRVDDLVTRIIASIGSVALHDAHFRELRQPGLEWSGIDPTQAAAALPLGLDGTAFYVAAPRFVGMPPINREDVHLIVDSVETVPPAGSNVTPASGDKLHATLIATIFPGA